VLEPADVEVEGDVDVDGEESDVPAVVDELEESPDVVAGVSDEVVVPRLSLR
jgi:hypothetical protein